jgi:tetratricopeptide (TPR) repeat protein
LSVTALLVFHWNRCANAATFAPAMTNDSVSSQLERLRELRAAERFDELVAQARALAAAHPAEVSVQLEAAYACDRYGEEIDAICYYDAAWQLGVPRAARKKFFVGYGSTLRNVGRIAESIERLQAAVAELPEVAALPAFLALSLHSAGRHDEAMVAALDAVLRTNAATSALDGYERALSHYRDEIESARVV